VILRTKGLSCQERVTALKKEFISSNSGRIFRFFSDKLLNSSDVDQPLIQNFRMHLGATDSNRCKLLCFG